MPNGWQAPPPDPGAGAAGGRPACDRRRGGVQYACHEGNYGMEGILAGARAAEVDEQ